MQRYFINQKINIGDKIFLSQEDNHHLIVVMRSKVNDLIEVVDLTQKVYLTKIISIDNNKLANIESIKIIEEVTHELPIYVTIATGLSKNDKLDWIVQKTTEMGMSNFYPVSLSRDVVQWKNNKAEDKILRLQKISKAAAEQSKRNLIPQISNLSSLDQFILETLDYDIKLIAYEETAKSYIHSQLKNSINSIKSNQRIVCIFGSEGGFDPVEIDKLLNAGFKSCSLGPRILRAETAPLYFLAALSYHLELNSNNNL